MTKASYVHLSDGTVWPHPKRVNEIEWRARYGELSREDVLVLASVASIYTAAIKGQAALSSFALFRLELEKEDE